MFKLKQLDRALQGEQRHERSGFFDLPKQHVCRDPGHQFPSHLHIPAGQGYRHVCPACGKTTTVTSPVATF